MLIPYRIKMPTREPPIVNIAIVAVCIVVFLLMMFGLVPRVIVDSLVLFRWNTIGLISHQFLHAGLFHLVFNMVFLWIFGNAVCGMIGNLAYLPVFLAPGVFGGLAHLVLKDGMLVGASGAISGIIAFAFVLAPTSRVNCLFYGGLFGGIFAVNAFWLIAFWFARDIWFAFFATETQVAHFAHIGGFVTGLIAAMSVVKAGLIEKEEDDPPTLLECLEKKEQTAGEESPPARSRLATLDFSFSSPSWLRWCVSLPLLLGYPYLHIKNKFDAPWLMLVGAIQIGPDIANWFGNMAGGLLWPHDEGKPTPIYCIPENLAGEGKFAEAEAEYEEIMRQFPHETKPHTDLIDIALHRMDDTELAEKFYRNGMQMLKKAEGKRELTFAYEGALALHNARKKREQHLIPLTLKKPDEPGKQEHD